MEKEKQETVKPKTKRSQKYQAVTELVIALALLVVLNIISSKVFTRIDFTKEKRYSLSDASKNLAQKLDDILFVRVYLDGELNPDFDRLRRSTKEMLDEFRIASDGMIDFEFIDPLEGKSNEDKAKIIQQLQLQGLSPTEVLDNANDQSTRRVIVPGAHFFYKTSQQYPLNLLQKQFGQQAQVVLNKSIEGLEYGIASTIRKVVDGGRKRVAFFTGHGELGEQETADLANELSSSYRLERFDMWMDTANPNFVNQFAGGLDSIAPEDAGKWLIDTLTNKLNSFDAVVIAQPIERFSEQEKFYIDQYVMNGGKIIWLIDPLIASLDSIGKYGTIVTGDYDLNLNDMLFEYGVRVNPDLIQDAECNRLILDKAGKLYPWVYHPIVVSKSDHPIVKNLNPILFRFASSIDTVGKGNIKKKVLLASSLYSRPVSNPVEISFNIAGRPPLPELLNKPEQPLAVLLEGQFTSVFKNRRRNTTQALNFKERSVETSMLVISDGDVIRNTVTSKGEMYPLGFDRNTKRVFDNKIFFINCLDYMLDESGLIEVRTKEFEIRPLNKVKVKAEETKWKTINMVLPIIAIIIFGLINGFIRRRRYVK
jgi:ABC-2 type transport system permease protein